MNFVDKDGTTKVYIPVHPRKPRYSLMGFRSQASTITCCYFMRHTKSTGTSHMHREFPDIQVNITSCLISEASSPSLFRTKNPYIRTFNFQGQAAVGSYLMITISNIRLSGS